MRGDERDFWGNVLVRVVFSTGKVLVEVVSDRVVLSEEEDFFGVEVLDVFGTLVAFVVCVGVSMIVSTCFTLRLAGSFFLIIRFLVLRLGVASEGGVSSLTEVF